MRDRIELERNEMSEILAQNFALNDQKFDAADFEWSAHCLQMAGFHKTEWISVEERLPQKPMRCLAYTRRGDMGGYDIAYYGGYYDGFSVLYGTVTHWMPLPEPPRTPKKEEE